MATAQTTLHSLCAGMPLSGKGPVEVEVYDIHQTGTQFYMGDKVKCELKESLMVVIDKVLYDIDGDVVIVFPDNGAFKRFDHLFRGDTKKFTCYVCSKMRDGDKRKVQIVTRSGVTDIKGATAVIVDDLVRTGGTILETATLLRQEGAAKVVAAFVHADFDKGAVYKFLTDPRLDAIYCTNSNPLRAKSLEFVDSILGLNKVRVRGLFGKREKETQVLFLASASNEKFKAVQKCFIDTRAVWTGAVRSYVPEQPFDSEGYTGALNRFRGIHYLNTGNRNHNYLALESYLAEKDGNYHESVAVFSAYYNRSVVPRCHVSNICIPKNDDMIQVCLKDQTKTYGSLMQQKFDLVDESAWLAYKGQSRFGMIREALWFLSYQ